MNLKSIPTRIIQKLKKWFKRKGYTNLVPESQALVHLAVIKTLNVSDQRHQAYSELATRCLYYLSGGANGKLDWQDCSDLVEEYYTNFVKGKIT